MCSFCNLLLLFCCNYFICKSKIISSLYLLLHLGCILQNPFFRIKICIVHVSFDVTIVDHVFMFKTGPEHTFSSLVFSIADVT